MLLSYVHACYLKHERNLNPLPVSMNIASWWSSCFDREYNFQCSFYQSRNFFSVPKWSFQSKTIRLTNLKTIDSNPNLCSGLSSVTCEKLCIFHHFYSIMLTPPYEDIYAPQHIDNFFTLAINYFVRIN